MTVYKFEDGKSLIIRSWLLFNYPASKNISRSFTIHTLDPSNSKPIESIHLKHPVANSSRNGKDRKADTIRSKDTQRLRIDRWSTFWRHGLHASSRTSLLPINRAELRDHLFSLHANSLRLSR